MIKITLNQEELKNVEVQFKASLSDAQNNHRKNVYGHSDNEEKAKATSKEGRFYEAVVCKFEGKPYVFRYFGVDTGKYEVRGTRYSYGKLLLHPKDRDEQIFILVTGLPPTFCLVGWIKGKDGKNPKFWSDPVGGRPAFFVPQTSLNPIEELSEYKSWKLRNQEQK